MALRPTRAEAEAAVAAQQLNTYVEFVNSYPARFAAVLYFYATESGEFSVKKVSATEYTLRDDNARMAVTLPVSVSILEEQNWTLVSNLEDVEYQMVQVAAARSEAERREQARRAAINKLSKEEQELLGLK